LEIRQDDNRCCSFAEALGMLVGELIEALRVVVDAPEIAPKSALAA
jgi:hypothetical protein